MIISYAQNFEDVMLWRALRHVERGYYIDVGANDPVIDSVTQLFCEHHWSGINIEPVVSHWEALTQARPRDINLCCAVGASIGELSLWQCEVRGWATANPAVIAQHQDKGYAGQFVKVPQTTLNQIWERHVREAVHFLKIDVEGLERQVLEGLDLQRYRPWIVVVEATHPGSTCESHEAWESLLTLARYALVYADGINRFYLAHEHGELAGAFKYPPNVFDAFVKAPEIQGNLWAKNISDRADTAVREKDLAEERVRQAEARMTELESQLAEAVAQIERLNNVRAGLFRRAIRALSQQAGIAGSRPDLPRLARLMRGTASLVRRSPRLRAVGLQLISPFPRLKARLKGMLLRAAISHPDAPHAPRVPAALAHLSPKVRDIYKALHEHGSPASQQTGIQSESGSRQSTKPRLAYVSPLPPVRSGIADYSAQCLPALAEHYDIDVVIEQGSLADDNRWIQTHCGVRTARWLLDHAQAYDRVLYHIGNSPAHDYMFPLLERVPGVVVLHDFHLADLLNYRESLGLDGKALRRGLYLSHGYTPLLKHARGEPFAQLAASFPANLEVVTGARGVIVHSLHAKRLAQSWYGNTCAERFSVIPLLRHPAQELDRASARQALGLPSDAFIVCSFGMMGATKLNHLLLDAWAGSAAAADQACRLIFVGEKSATDYNHQIQGAIDTQAGRQRIAVTGWNPPQRYLQYLAAADLAVQLRSHSRGETSAAVLDCMNHGLPTIVNAHGSMVELPRDAVWMLDDSFDVADLSRAIDMLWKNRPLRETLAKRGRELMVAQHSPAACGKQYKQVIEQIHSEGYFEETLIKRAALSARSQAKLAPDDLIGLAQSVASQLPPVTATRQLLVDVSATCRSDLKTGIQRVVRALVWSLLQSPPAGYRIEPVYLSEDTGRWHYRYARQWTATACGIQAGWMPDDPIDFSRGDALLIADYLSAMAVSADQAGVFASLQACGVGVHFVVYDLLPILMPQHFPPNSFDFAPWLNALSARADSAHCISQSVAEDLRQWMHDCGPPRARPLRVGWFHLGADLIQSIPTRGLPPDAAQTLTTMRSAPSFLMVGTIEPRKGHMQCLQAFTELWANGLNVNLVIVGQEGWQGMPDRERRGIPELVHRIRTHPELGKRLLWLHSASDEFLSRIYAESTCLIAASEGEGFGLPLIEAARQGLAIIARDIPVFREVAGSHANYFSGLDTGDLAQAIQGWLTLKAQNKQTASDGLRWLTWQESTRQLLEALQLESSLEPSPSEASVFADRSRLTS